MENLERDFKGIYIPKEVWLDEQLTPLEKFILADISSLDGESGCSASNEYLAKFCQCSVTKVSNAINKLIKLNYLYVESFNGKVRILRSGLNLSYKICKSVLQNLYTDNNIYNINSTINSINPINNVINNNIYNNILAKANIAETSSALPKTTPIINSKSKDISKKEMSNIKKNSSIKSKIKYIVETHNIKNQKLIDLFKQWLDVVYDKGFRPSNTQLDLIIKQLLEYKDKFGPDKLFEIMQATIRTGYKDFSYFAPKSNNINTYQHFNPEARCSKEERLKRLSTIEYEDKQY